MGMAFFMLLFSLTTTFAKIYLLGSTDICVRVDKGIRVYTTFNKLRHA